MSGEPRRRIWAYAELSMPAEEIGNLKRWRLVGGDPVQLLEEALPFIGWSGCPDGLKERIQALIDAAEG